MTDFATITAKLDCPHEVIGPCLLINGDCLKVLPTLAPGSVDAVVTDPPYGQTNETYDSPVAFDGTVWTYLAHRATESK
jgi:DNA modification methylase